MIPDVRPRPFITIQKTLVRELGFAYRITEDGNTSIRGGAGYYYEAPNTVAFEDVVGVPPFAPIINLSNRFGSSLVSLADPYGSPESRICFPGSLVLSIQPRALLYFPARYLIQSDIRPSLPLADGPLLESDAERGFKQDWMLRVAYVGNNGHHLSGTGDQESGLLQLNPRFIFRE